MLLAGILLVLVAVPTLFVFESMTAVSSVFLNRQTWYDVMAQPAVYDATLDEIQGFFTENPPQRETLRMAAPPAYIQSQLNRLVDYSFALLNGSETPPPTFDVPAPLAEAVRQAPNLSFLQVVEGEGGALQVRANVSERSQAQVRGLATQYNIAMMISAGIGAVFLLMATFVAADSTRGRLIWLGSGLMLASLAVLIVGLTFNTAFAPLIDQRLAYDSRDLNGLILATMTALADILPRLGTALTVAGGIPFVIGLVLLIVGSVMRPRRPEIARYS